MVNFLPQMTPGGPSSSNRMISLSPVDPYPHRLSISGAMLLKQKGVAHNQSIRARAIAGLRLYESQTRRLEEYSSSPRRNRVEHRPAVMEPRVARTNYEQPKRCGIPKSGTLVTFFQRKERHRPRTEPRSPRGFSGSP
jgi:hypothetical protein